MPVVSQGGQIEPKLSGSNWLHAVLARQAPMIHMTQVRRIGVAGPVQAGPIAIFQGLRSPVGRTMVIMK